jgi:hypothetical protein
MNPRFVLYRNTKSLNPHDQEITQIALDIRIDTNGPKYEQ